MPARHANPTHVRPVALDWSRDDQGAWIATGYADPGQWEVFCVECGDVDGPRDIQPEAVRHLRKPRTRIQAEWLALHHERGAV